MNSSLGLPGNAYFKKERIECSFQLPHFVKTAGKESIIGCAASFVFTAGNPVSGAIFAGTQSVMQSLLRPGVIELLSDEENLPSRVYTFVVTYLISAIVSISISIALGFPISFLSATILSAVMYPTTFLIDYIAACAFSKKKRR